MNVAVPQAAFPVLSANPTVRLTSYVFEDEFGIAPAVAWFAPGCLVLMGQGDRALTVGLRWGGVLVAAGRHPDAMVELISLNDYSFRVSVQPDSLGDAHVPSWAKPCVEALAAAAFTEGARLAIQHGDPAQTGLLTGVETFWATSLALETLYGAGTATVTADDPYHVTALRAREGHTLLIDGGEIEYLPFDLVAMGLRLLIIELPLPTSPALRQTDPLDDRAMRVLRAGDMAELGQLLTRHHVRGVEEMDLALDAALSAGALGGRAVGRCVVALAPMAELLQIRSAVMASLSGVTRRPPRFLTAVPAGGARRVH